MALFSSVTQAFGVISLRRDDTPPTANFLLLTEAPFQGLALPFPPPVLTAPFSRTGPAFSASSPHISPFSRTGSAFSASSPHRALFSRTGPAFSASSPYISPFSRTGPTFSASSPYISPFSRTGPAFSASSPHRAYLQGLRRSKVLTDSILRNMPAVQIQQAYWISC